MITHLRLTYKKNNKNGIETTRKTSTYLTAVNNDGGLPLQKLTAIKIVHSQR